MRKWVLGAVVGVGVLMVMGLVYVDRMSNGIVGFHVWKAVSGVHTRSAQAELDTVSIYYETFGDPASDALPVLVMHGGTAFLETMHYQIELLADSRFVIAPDSRAHGRSADSGGTPLTYSLMADDMVALLDQLGIAKVDIVGWSDGGNIGLDMALRYPDRVNRLVMYGSNFHFSGTGGALSDSAVPDPNAEQWAAVRSFYENVAPDPSQWPVFLSRVMTMWREHPTHTVEELGTLAHPVLVMAGEFDSILDAHTREMAAAIPGSQLVIVEGEDHYAPLMAPDKVNPVILAFLR